MVNLKHHHSQFLCVISQSTYYSKSSQFSTMMSQFLNFDESTQSAFSADEQLWKVFMIFDWIECVKVPNTSFHSINNGPSVDVNMGIWSLCSSIYRKSFIVSLMKRFRECYLRVIFNRDVVSLNRNPKPKACCVLSDSCVGSFLLPRGQLDVSKPQVTSFIITASLECEVFLDMALKQQSREAVPWNNRGKWKLINSPW